MAPAHPKPPSGATACRPNSLERRIARAMLSTKGLRPSLGLMVNYLYDLDRIETGQARVVGGRVMPSRAISALH